MSDAPSLRQPVEAEPEPTSCGYQGYEFGASYPDSVCIDGYLWDADSCDEPGSGFHIGGEIPCPACNTSEYLSGALEDAKDGCCGVAMFTPWVAAVVWESACAVALKHNPAAAEAFLQAAQPFETEDWPDRAAVYDGRAPWDLTVPVTYRGAVKHGAPPQNPEGRS